tara:strand:+ start:366 stop:2399 length:2034 start_codon:yes stop_codon:yes gene_type:complete
MKTIVSFIFFIIFFYNFSNANIVEELTSLNNLYKDGAITKEEFSKAKSILLQSNNKEKSKKKIEKVKKKKIEKKEINKSKVTKVVKKEYEEDLTKTYISLQEFSELGTYKKIENYPDGLFRVKSSSEAMAKDAMMKMYDTFVRKPGLMEKYPENMMKAMAYFEIFYNYQLKEKKRSIEKFKKNYPNISWRTKKDIKSLYSLNFAKKSMREALSLNMENELEVALERYVFMHDFLKPAEKTKHKLSRKEKKLKKASTKLKQNYGKLKKTFLSKSENRIDTKDFQKQLKKNIKETKKVLKVVTNLDQETDKFYVSINRLFEQSLDFLDNCQPDCKKKDLVTLIDAIKLNENLLKEIEPKIIKKQYSQNMDGLNIDNLSDDEKSVLGLINIKNKIKIKESKIELQQSSLNLENSGFNIDETLNQLNVDGFEIKSVSMSFDNIDNMKKWATKDWANSWRGELPTNIKDTSGNLIEFSSENIQDIKAQLAYSSFNNLIDPSSLKDSVNESINENIKEIVNEITNDGGFNIDEFLNQDFSITLNNYSELVGNSLGIEMANFDDLTNVVNDLYGTDMTSEAYADHWQTAQYLDSTSNWGDVTMGVDLINQLGSFDAASIANDLGTSLQTVADSISAAANVGIATDLEAAAQGLGYSSFAAAVSAYNEEHGTNYTEESAAEALGQ